MPRIRYVNRRRRWQTRAAKARVRRSRMRMAKKRQIVHRFKRAVFYSGSISGSTILDTFGGVRFRLVDVPNVTEFTNLFDQYKIDGVKIHFLPRGNTAEVGTNQGIVKFFSAIDYDDITAPGSINDILQYENVKTTRSTQDHSRYIKPKVAGLAYQTAVGNAYMPKRGWIDCANTTVEHYGIKWALQQLPAGSQTFDIKVDYYLSFKNVV